MTGHRADWVRFEVADDGTVHAAWTWDREMVVARWPAGEPLPTRGESAERDPGPADEVVSLAEGEQPEVGVRYAVPLYLDCGISRLQVGGTFWRRSDHGPSPEFGNQAPDHWPIAGGRVFGYATIVDEGELEYSTPSGEVIATYVSSSAGPMACY